MHNSSDHVSHFCSVSHTVGQVCCILQPLRLRCLFLWTILGRRRNGEVALCRAAGKTSSSMAVTSYETLPDKSLLKAFYEGIAGLYPVDQKLLSLDEKQAPFLLWLKHPLLKAAHSGSSLCFLEDGVRSKGGSTQVWWWVLVERSCMINMHHYTL